MSSRYKTHNSDRKCYNADMLRRDGYVTSTQNRQVRGHVVDDVTGSRPTFRKTQQNVTVVVGQRAVLQCRVDNLADRIVRRETRPCDRPPSQARSLQTILYLIIAPCYKPSPTTERPVNPNV